MKKLSSLCCAAAAVIAAFTACDKSEKGYEGTNYVYISADANSLFDTEDASVTLTVSLTTALSEDISIPLSADSDVISLSENPVTIKAGAKSATLTAKAAAQIQEASVSVKIGIGAALPETVKWSGEELVLTVNSSVVKPLTEAQAALVDAYKKATGIDVSKFLGLVKVSTTYTASSAESDVPEEPVTISGVTAIELGEAADGGAISLNMTVNPMGLFDTLHKKFRSQTIENDAYWFDEYSSDNYSVLCDAIGWTKTSQETFSMVLNGIILNADKTVDFLRMDENDYLKVPFVFGYSAYDREADALSKGTDKFGTAYDEYWMDDATADPNFHLNCDDISEDLYESGNWIEASASLSADKLEFTFCIYNYNDYDYSKVTAVYTPNK